MLSLLTGTAVSDESASEDGDAGAPSPRRSTGFGGAACSNRRLPPIALAAPARVNKVILSLAWTPPISAVLPQVLLLRAAHLLHHARTARTHGGTRPISQTRLAQHAQQLAVLVLSVETSLLRRRRAISMPMMHGARRPTGILRSMANTVIPVTRRSRCKGVVSCGLPSRCTRLALPLFWMKRIWLQPVSTSALAATNVFHVCPSSTSMSFAKNVSGIHSPHFDL